MKERLQKIIAAAGICSRRAAEELPEFRAAFLDLAAAAERNASALLCLMQRYV